MGVPVGADVINGGLLVLVGELALVVVGEDAVVPSAAATVN
jgi:hypothetical protein